MTMVKTHEDERIRNLIEGPWNERSALAYQMLSRDSLTHLPGDQPRKLQTGAVSNDRPQERLSRILRGHWEAKIIDKEEIQIRDSLDWALTELSLFELAIETGYVPASSVKTLITDKLERLLWSESTRRFTEIYNYLSVIYLSQRLAVDLGFRSLPLPTINPNAQVRFGSFLSQYHGWVRDTDIECWLRFLDDYVYHMFEKGAFRNYITTGRVKKQYSIPRFNTLISGSIKFINELSDLLLSFPKGERLSYGLFYHYWLGKFFGYNITQHGFRYNTLNWAELISGSPIYTPQDVSEDAQTYYRTLLNTQITLLRDNWSQVQASLEEGFHDSSPRTRTPT